MEGKPLGNVTWRKDGQVVSNDTRVNISNPREVGRANSTLTITNLTRGDEGRYTCTVNNSVGAATSGNSSGYLTVNCKYFGGSFPNELFYVVEILILLLLFD